jgi:cell division protein FtsX
MLLLKMAIWLLLFVIVLAIALTLLVPEFGRAFYSKLAETPDTWVILAGCLLLAMYMTKKSKRDT